MQRRVERELADTDVVLFVINAVEGVGAGDRFIAGLLAVAAAPVVVAVNKVDRAPEASVVAALAAAGSLGIAEAIVPISARNGDGIEALIGEIAHLLPEGPMLFPAGSRSDQPLETELAELVREQVLRRTRQEVPHAVEVQVEELATREDGVLVVTAALLAETESQKRILVGRGGSMVKSVGTAARKEIERLTGEKVRLDLSVRVRRDWRGDARLLDSLGID